MKGKSRLPNQSLTDQKNAVKAQVKRAKDRARKLLKKHNKDIREVRKQVAALKRAGIVSKRIDARSYQPSKYMLKKIKQNKDVLEGSAIPVKAPKKVRDKYRDAGTFETRGSAIIVPKDREAQTAKIRRGKVETRTRLKNGEEIRVILPFKAKDLQQIAERLASDPSLDGLKDPLELWGARIFGHNVAGGIGWPDANELGDYILRNYTHLFSGKNRQAAIRNFELVRFVTDDSNMLESDPDNRVIDDEWRRRNKQGNEWSIRRRKERRAKQAQERRNRETPEQRKERLDKQRERSKRNREAQKRKG